MAPVGATDVPVRRVDDGGISIRLVDLPKARAKDPRARTYIIDHLRPGATIHRRIEVHNNSAVRQRVELYPVGATIDENTFTALPERGHNELSGWVSTDLDHVDLRPWVKATIRATIRVPATASAGERYAAVLAQVTRPPTESGNVGRIHRVGVRIYLNVGPGGEPPTDFRVGDLAVSPGQGEWPVVTATVQNTGQRALDMTGSLSLSRESGTAKAGPFKITAGVTILPDQTGQVSAEVNEPLTPGRWKARLVLTSGLVQRVTEGTITLPGPVEAAAPQPGGQRPPLLAVGAGAALAVALLALLLYGHRRRTRASTSTADR